MVPFDFQSVLKKHLMKHLFEVKRKPKVLENVAGYVVAFSKPLILLNRLEWNPLCQDGYTVIRAQDIRLFRFFDKPGYWQFRAARQKGLQAVAPAGVSLGSLSVLLTSAAEHSPLLNLQAEKRYPDICFIGVLASVSDRTLTLEELDANSEWIGPRRLPLADITRVDFGGGYEQALAGAAPKRTPAKK